MLATDKSSWHTEENLCCLFGLIFSADRWSLDLLLGLGDCVEIVCGCPERCLCGPKQCCLEVMTFKRSRDLGFNESSKSNVLIRDFLAGGEHERTTVPNNWGSLRRPFPTSF